MPQRRNKEKCLSVFGLPNSQQQPQCNQINQGAVADGTGHDTWPTCTNSDSIGNIFCCITCITLLYPIQDKNICTLIQIHIYIYIYLMIKLFSSLSYLVFLNFISVKYFFSILFLRNMNLSNFDLVNFFFFNFIIKKYKFILILSLIIMHFSRDVKQAYYAL